MLLCDVRPGSAVRFVRARGREAGLRRLRSGGAEEQSAAVLRIERRGVVLSVGARNVIVPAWVARATLVCCTRGSRSKSIQSIQGEKP